MLFDWLFCNDCVMSCGVSLLSYYTAWLYLGSNNLTGTIATEIALMTNLSESSIACCHLFFVACCHLFFVACCLLIVVVFLLSSLSCCVHNIFFPIYR